MSGVPKILLDEVGEMSLRVQALLLWFLENGEIQAVGSDEAQARVAPAGVDAERAGPDGAARGAHLQVDGPVARHHAAGPARSRSTRLERIAGTYKELLTLFGMTSRDYRRFMTSWRHTNAA